VIDVGCGRGVWLEEWRRNGIEDAIGADGDYVDRNRLLIPRERFSAFDLAQGFNLGRRFDLVQSLEVAEHIPASQADRLIESLTAHGDLMLFSAATPGQGGEFHVNEQPPEYWRTKFANRGFLIFDCIRPQIVVDSSIEPWYRYNTFFYAHEQAWDGIPEEFRRTWLPPNTPIVDVSPLSWRLRSAFFRRLPQPAVQRLARLKHRMVLLGMLPG
jgi:hypothetical protein